MSPEMSTLFIETSKACWVLPKKKSFSLTTT